MFSMHSCLYFKPLVCRGRQVRMSLRPDYSTYLFKPIQSFRMRLTSKTIFLYLFLVHKKVSIFSNLFSNYNFKAFYTFSKFLLLFRATLLIMLFIYNNNLMSISSSFRIVWFLFIVLCCLENTFEFLCPHCFQNNIFNC